MARAQTAGGGLLERLRKSGVARLGITSGLPYSILNPDGSVGGVAPTITRLVLERIGIAKVEGIVATYGQLIPGLQAGRWDMIAADMTITKARCQEVAYADPFTIDRAAYVYLPATLPSPPKTIKEIGERGLSIGMVSGAYNLKLVQSVHAAPDRISIFPDGPSIMEAMLTGRVQIGCVGIQGARQNLEARPGTFAYIYPLPDDLVSPASAAFRPADTDLIEAFQAEYRKMKKSGEAEKIITGFKFDVLPGNLETTSAQACQNAA